MEKVNPADPKEEKRLLTSQLIVLTGFKHRKRRKEIQKRLDEINKLLKGQK